MRAGAVDPAEHAAQPHQRLDNVLWVIQAVLAAAFVLAGASHLAMSDDQLAAMGLSPILAHFIGAAEIAGAAGLLLPAGIAIAPILTPIAATAIAAMMLLATAFHFIRSEYSHMPLTIALGALAAIVAWARFWKVPFVLK